MNPNYPSASQAIRNLADLKLGHKVILEVGKFRVIRFESPFVNGAEFWVVNEKGFLWEPVDSLEEACAYLESAEAREYNSS